MIREKQLVWHGKPHRAQFLKDGKNLWIHIDGETYCYTKPSVAEDVEGAFDFGPVKSPMPGKIQKVNYKSGDLVPADKSIVVLEAMKMEYVMKVPKEAKLVSVEVAEGEQVKEGQILFVVEESE
tara:strand:- start:3063 stop:3434 length:372 start_codon:yes stop_codon:yes gene_type:complete